MGNRSVRILIVLFFVAASISAATISGKVKDAGDGSPIDVVEVTVFHGATNLATTHTDGNGEYKIENLPANTPVELRFAKTGYLRHPEKRAGTTASSEMEECLLVQQNGTRDYYKGFAKSLSEGSKTHQHLYEALPNDSKLKVNAAMDEFHMSTAKTRRGQKKGND